MEGKLGSTSDGRYVLRFECRLAHSMTEVWRALTDPEALDHWFPQEVEADLRPGGKILFSHRTGGAREPLPGFDGEIADFDPPRLISYTWGGDLLRWELRPDPAGCLLLFSDMITEVGKAARDAAGWQVCLEALVASLDRTAPPPGDRWSQVHPGYVDRFGPRAATIGPPGAS
jgi:uncharacterized protein YndB with AHSA1/START domain